MMRNKLRQLREELQLRKHIRLTQKDIGEASGVGERAYQQYEKGVRNISLKNLIRLAEFFDVSCDEILLHPLPERYTETSPEEQKLLSAYRRLSDQHRNLILMIIQFLAPESISIQRSATLRKAGRDAGNSVDPLPDPPQNPDALPNVEDL